MSSNLKANLYNGEMDSLTFDVRFYGFMADYR